MKVYLAGPMRGYPSNNFPAFFEAAKKLRSSGYEVISPAEMDKEKGFDENTEASDDFLRDAIMNDLKVICEVEGLVVIPGWEKSKGCAVEVALAKFLNLPVLDYTVM